MDYNLSAQLTALRAIRKWAGFGKGITVAILDGCIDRHHPDLSAQNFAASPKNTGTTHGTAVASIIASNKSGIAPNVDLIDIPVFKANQTGGLSGCSQFTLAKAIQAALAANANIINISGACLSNSGYPNDEIRHAIDECQKQNVQVVASVGNDALAIDSIPASVDGVLAVGAHDKHGQIAHFNNLGPQLIRKTVFAPGVDIRFDAKHQTATISGSSFAAPIVSGTCALVRAIEKNISNADLYKLILRSSIPYNVNSDFTHANMSALSRLDFLQLRENLTPKQGHFITPHNARKDRLMQIDITQPIVDSNDHIESVAPAEYINEINPAEAPIEPKQSLSEQPIGSNQSIQDPATHVFVHDPAAHNIVQPQTIQPQAAVDNKVFAFGTIGYDFVNETNRDYFQQAMYALGERHPHLKPLVPENEISMARFLSFRDENGNQPYMDSATALVWTLKVDGIPIYSIHPQDQFAIFSFSRLLDYLIEQTGLTTNDITQADVDTPTLMTKKLEIGVGVEKIDRVSIAGYITGQTRLYNGHIVPQIDPQLRGMFAWDSRSLAKAALGESPKSSEVDQLRNFLERIYYELRNRGAEPADRALNFAATNAYQAAEVFVDALDRNLELNAISVERSPVSRPGSDFHDVVMEFFDPENKDRRARRLYRYTIDVSGVMPVTFGELRSWNKH